ncbi:MAG: T9SS type A sorting domain-containing protein [Bacteroidia bacterium]|nr:T9SS type A sorting domain-containing protein [Bacteroidia bacterium]
MKKIFFLFALTAQIVWAQSNWTHVGPTKSASSGLYESGRLDVIEADPGYNGTTNKTIYAGGVAGGFWKTTDDGANWASIPTTTLYYGGVGDIAIHPSGSPIYVADVNVLNGHMRLSSSVYKYNVGAGTWTSAVTFPSSPLLSATVKFKINHIKIHPANDQIVFACTTVGIYRSTDGAASWTLVDATAGFENIAFMPVSGGYNVYASGDLKKFKVSTDNGTSFSDETWSNATTISYDNVYFDLAYADSLAGTKIVYLVGVVTHATAFTVNYPSSTSTRAYVLYKFRVNGSGVKNLDYVMTFKDTDPNTDRMAIWGNEDVAYMGGDRIWKYNFNTSLTGVYDPVGWSNGIDDVSISPSTSPSYYWPGTSVYNTMIHPDVHDIKLFDDGTTRKMFAATDGGFNVNTFSFTASAGVYNNSWQYLNNNMDISQIWGFSSAESDTTIYSTGEADTKGFLFKSDMSKVKTFQIEPAFTFIDKFKDSIMFHGPQMWGSNTTVIDYDYEGASSGFSSLGSNALKEANPSLSYFEPATTNSASGRVSRNGVFYQHPVTGKVYHTDCGIWEYSETTKTFGLKYRTGQFLTNTSSNAFGTDYLLLRDHWTVSAVSSVAFSPTNPDKIYMTGEVWDGGSGSSYASQVYSFIGPAGGKPAWSDTWGGHNDAGAFELITPNLKTLISSSLTDAEIFKVIYQSVAVSDWDPNKIWVAMTSPAAYPQYKVLKLESGAWSDYSTGLPSDEEVVSMVYERGSNDGLYLGTNRSVYYRNASMLSWVPYSTNIPNLFMVQMDVNYNENTLRSGTFGRGIWKTNLNCPSTTTLAFNSVSIAAKYHEANYITATNCNLQSGAPKILRATNSITLNTGFVSTTTTGTNNYFLAFIHGCSSPGNSFKIINGGGNSFALEEENENEEMQQNSIRVYPNPNNGSFTLAVNSEEEKNIFVYDVMGKLVFQKMKVMDRIQAIDISNQPKGIYLVKVQSGNTMMTEKIIKE